MTAGAPNGANRRHRRWVVWTLLVGGCAAILLLLGTDVAAQCQMCRTGLTQSPEGQRWARGINAGILLLLAAPFLIAGSIALVIYQSQLMAVVSKLRARGGFFISPQLDPDSGVARVIAKNRTSINPQ